MSLDSNDVARIASLARLALAKDEAAGMQRELAAILELVERMQAVNTVGVEPLAHPLDYTARLRPDAVTEGNEREKFQSLAPAVQDGHYLVPRVIE